MPKYEPKKKPTRTKDLIAELDAVFRAMKKWEEEDRIERAEQENRYRNICIDEDLEELRW